MADLMADPTAVRMTESTEESDVSGGSINIAAQSPALNCYCEHLTKA